VRGKQFSVQKSILPSNISLCTQQKIFAIKVEEVELRVEEERSRRFNIMKFYQRCEDYESFLFSTSNCNINSVECHWEEKTTSVSKNRYLFLFPRL
jgi:hypothetical protein